MNEWDYFLHIYYTMYLPFIKMNQETVVLILLKNEYDVRIIITWNLENLYL